MKVSPLSSGFMLTGLLGVVITALWSDLWRSPVGSYFGVALLIFFSIMVTASLVSLTFVDLNDEDALRELESFLR